jgi:hypothetical protein
MKDLIEKVRAFNATVRGPYGAPPGHSVLDAVIFYLENGDLEAARWKVQYDTDKLTSYPGVMRFCAENGLMTDEYLARIRKHTPWWLEG